MSNPYQEDLKANIEAARRFKAQRDALMEALRPFADIISMVECTSSHEYYDTDTWEVPIAFLRIARRELERVRQTG